MSSPLSLFVSYSGKDKPLADQMVAHLGTISWLVTPWYDADLEAADHRPWEEVLRPQLESARVIVILYSSDYANTPFCRQELTFALEQKRARKAAVFIVHLRHVGAFPPELIKFQVRPSRDKAVTDAAAQGELDAAMSAIVAEIRRYAEAPAEEPRERQDHRHGTFLRFASFLAAFSKRNISHAGQASAKITWRDEAGKDRGGTAFFVTNELMFTAARCVPDTTDGIEGTYERRRLWKTQTFKIRMRKCPDLSSEDVAILRLSQGEVEDQPLGLLSYLWIIFSTLWTWPTKVWPRRVRLASFYPGHHTLAEREHYFRGGRRALIDRMQTTLVFENGKAEDFTAMLNDPDSATRDDLTGAPVFDLAMKRTIGIVTLAKGPQLTGKTFLPLLDRDNGGFLSLLFAPISLPFSKYRRAVATLVSLFLVALVVIGYRVSIDYKTGQSRGTHLPPLTWQEAKEIELDRQFDAISPNGEWSAYARDGKLTVHRLTGGDSVHELPPCKDPKTKELGCSTVVMAVSSTGEMVVAVRRGVLEVWRIDVKGVSASPFGLGPKADDGSSVQAVAIDPASSRLAVAFSPLAVFLYGADPPAPTRLELAEASGALLLNVLAFSADGKSLAAGGGGSVRVWLNVDSQDFPEQFTMGGPLRALSFSGDGKLLSVSFPVTCKGEGERPTIWDIGATCEPGKHCQIPAPEPYAVAFFFGQSLYNVRTKCP